MNIYDVINIFLVIVTVLAIIAGFVGIGIGAAKIFEKIRRRRKAQMEDTMTHDEWKGGNPNASVPESAKPVKFDPDDFVG